MKLVQFGAEGWRGVIADDFTYHRVCVVSEAIGEHLREENMARRGIVIGFDNRFASEECAHLAATVLTQMDIPVRISTTSVPTPVVAYNVRYNELGGGIMVTAGGHPARENGIKFIPWFGGTASPEATRKIEERANTLLETLKVDAIREKGPENRLLSYDDFVPVYLKHVLAFVDISVIREQHLRLVVDPLYGSSVGVLDRALREAGCTERMIHGERNSSFGGLRPAPTAENLLPLIATVHTDDLDGAVAADGDGGRIGAVAEDGQYVSPQQLLALLLMHLVEDRGMRGGVAKDVATSAIINQLADRYHLVIFETPMGFEYISQLMLEQDILIGGEESGGIGVKGHIPERDATLAALLLCEMMAMRQTTLTGLLAQLHERVGEHHYRRVDVQLQHPVTPEQFANIRENLPARIEQLRIVEVTVRDGMKLLLEDGSWLLLRALGTEPVLRVYAEAETPGKVEGLLQAASAMITSSDIRRAA